jgi:hypothetical protein
MTTEEKIARIVQRLHAKTAAKEIKWERTSRSDVFQTALPNYVVKVSTTPSDQSMGLDYVVSIVDASGAVLESASDVDVTKVFTQAYPMMKDLYEMARRSALGVDAALDSLLAELE